MIMALVAWCGDIEDGQEVMDRFRGLAEPIADMVQEMPYPEIYGPEDEEIDRWLWLGRCGPTASIHPPQRQSSAISKTRTHRCG